MFGGGVAYIFLAGLAGGLGVPKIYTKMYVDDDRYLKKD